VLKQVFLLSDLTEVLGVLNSYNGNIFRDFKAFVVGNKKKAAWTRIDD